MKTEPRIVVCRACLRLGIEFEPNRVRWEKVRLRVLSLQNRRPTTLCPDCRAIEPYPVDSPRADE